MKIAAAVALLHLCLSATVSGDESTETTVAASPGDVALLPCYTAGNVTPSVTTWEKNGREIMSGGDSSSSSSSSSSSPSPSPAAQRLTVLHDGSLNINGVTPGDEGSYLCGSTLPGNITFHARVLLQVTDGPDNVSTSISPGHVLLNGTIIVYQGSSVSFNCSASSYPSQQLKWAFAGASSNNGSLTSGSGAWLAYRIEDIQPSAQGVYSCTANNTVSYQAVNRSSQLLVYYAPDRHPECMWSPAQDTSHIQFTCSWSGAYPTPTLSWEDDGGAQGQGHVYATEVTDSLSVTMNRSQLSDGQTLRCVGQHQTLAAGKEKSCSFTLKPPYPAGEPMVTTLEATSVTLTCSEEASIPPANTTWRKGMEHDVIVSGSKYVLSEEGPVYKLTILNVSQEDGGLYFCRSENPLAITELEVYLTVKASSEYTGVIVGIFIAALILGSAVIIAKTVYSSRHRICLGGGFGQMEEDRGDVLSLVESEDEHIFQDAVPELPPLPNGRQTTLVQIHRIPSSDHEDAETADTSPEQQDDTEQTEELVDLVTF